MMEGILFWIKQLVCFSLGCFYASLVCLVLLIDFIRSPIKYVRDTFFKELRSVPPCLNDPSLGSHGYLHLQDVKLHYVASGDEKKPLMLMLHGFPGFWYSWKYQIKEFSKDYRVVAVDQRGYADSDKPSGWRNYSLSKLSGDVKQVVPALGYKSCTLLCHDWGCLIGWRFACQNPDLVDKLVILNGPSEVAFRKHIFSSPIQFLKSWYMLFFQVPLIPELASMTRDYAVVNMMLKNLPNYKVAEEDVEAYKYAFSAKGALTNPLNWYRALFRLEGEPLPTFSKPVLAIWGEPDHALSVDLAYMSQEHASDLTVKTIQGSDHIVQLDKYQECNDLIREFLKEK